jgi:hypothetical protein
MGTKRLSTRPRSQLSREQKVAFVLLSFLGIGGLFLGFRSFGASLNRPLQLQILEHATGEAYLSPQQKATKEREEQKKLDTDLDGLSDYDELYVYRTSAYLSDSDSDGVDDKTEIFAGADPNCPAGTTCGVSVQNEESSNDTPDASGFLNVFSDTQGAISAGSVSIDGVDDIESFFNGLTKDQLRQALMQSGISQDQLSEIGDADLQNYLRQALEQVKQGESSNE